MHTYIFLKNETSYHKKNQNKNESNDPKLHAYFST